MDNKKDDKYYAQKAIAELDILIEYINNVSFDEYTHDTRLIDATMFRFTQLVEYIKGLSDKFKDNHQEIPWNKIVGFRNKIVHEYGRIDYSVVYEIMHDDVHKLKEILATLL